jgi:RNA polymerase sigma-70 factor (ECF subfamily)
MIRACAEGNSASAWTAFIEEFQPVIAATVIKTARRFESCSLETIDDLIQETYVRICASRVLQTFRSEEPKAIYGLLQAVTYSVVQDHFRAERTQKRGGNVRTISTDEANVLGDNQGAEVIERDVLIGEIEAILQEVAPSARDRQIFWLHHRHGLTSKDISKVERFCLSPKGVESVIQRLLADVRRRLISSARKYLKGRKGTKP